MEILIYIFIFIMGAFIGSFSSLAIYRIPLKEDILIKHSYCPKCKAKLTFLDLIPIFSYIFLKGKCRHCSEKIRIRYLGLELLSGILFVLFIFSFNMNLFNINIHELLVAFFIAIFFVSFILIAGIDKENKKIEYSILLFDLCVSIVYIMYMFYLNINIVYDLIIFIVAIIFYFISKFLIKNEKDKYVINFSILILISRIFINTYIILFALCLTLITFILHKFLVKTSVPVVFYYIVFIISIFIGTNFII